MAKGIQIFPKKISGTLIIRQEKCIFAAIIHQEKCEKGLIIRQEKCNCNEKKAL